MKKTLFSLLSAAALLWSTSCSDETIAPEVGGESLVQFTVELNDGTSASRAISDGSGVNKLYYEVYSVANDGTKTLLPALDNWTNEINDPETITGKTATVGFPLVKGQKYDIVFWAQKDNVYNAQNLQSIAVGTTANNDDLDAFTAVYRIESVEGAQNHKVYLTRPFAQVNFGTTTDDITWAEQAGIKFNNNGVRLQSQITVEDAALTYNALTELPNEDVKNCNAVVFAWNRIPEFTETLLELGEDVNKVTYKYIATAYVLVPTAEQIVANLKMEMETGLNENITLTVPNAPIQRNYRTNVIGNLLTNQTDFTVIVDANYLTPDNVETVWDGKSIEEIAPKQDEQTGETVYEVSNGAQLAYLAELVNGVKSRSASAQSYNIKLTGNINLGNNPWTAIGTETNQFVGTFDGNGYVISDLKIVETEAKEGKAYLGFFGYAKDATIKNVTFEDVNINVACLDIDHSQGHIAAVAGSLEGKSTIENVTVKGDVKVEATTTANGASRVAVVAGGNAYGDVTMKNVHVIANEGSYLKANNNVGALAGQLQGKSVFENCSSNINVTGTKFFAGGIIGLAAGDQLFTNCHTTGNITITAGRAGRVHDHYRVGGIAGGWADGAKNVCTLTGCSFTGKLSGTNADGSVAEAFDYAGYVGRGYTLNNCAGSKVVINGVEYVQAFNTAAEAGIYYVDGKLVLNTASALKTFAAKVNAGTTFEGETVKLGADIDLKNAEWAPIGSAYKDHGFMGNFDGNGKTIKNLMITKITSDDDGYVYAGLFGVTEGTESTHNYIKNLTIENVTIATEGDIVAAAIAYPYYTDIENVLVKGNVNIKGGNYTAGVLAYTRRCVNAENIAIEANTGSVIEGDITVGGVISDIQMNGGLKAIYSNFTATGLTIKANKNVGGISGIICEQTLNGATVKNVNIVSEDARKGIVAGADGGNGIVTNVTYENVTGATEIIGAAYK